jgi:arylsulfatase A-like enzyme
MVIFTSDNGPSLIFREQGGSAGLLRGGKNETYEGGMREPAIFRWPGTIKPGVVMELGTTMDLLPTICGLANAKLPNDRIYDGYNITPALLGKGPNPRDIVFYYRGTEVFAVRKGSYKAHFITQPDWPSNTKTVQDPPLLFNVNIDPSEKYDIADQHPDIIAEIRKIMEEHKATVVKVENQLEK